MTQSNYIPWRGYFDLIAAVDEFIIYDEVQYSKQSWRNRNRIKGRGGAHWLIVPVQSSLRSPRTIADTSIVEDGWNRRHWKSLGHVYSRAPYFKAYAPIFEELYQRSYATLSELNVTFIRAICPLLGIDTPIREAFDFPPVSGKLTRACNMARLCGAGTYVSGPSGRDYIDPAVFAAGGVEIEWFDYPAYAPYEQLGAGFDPSVSILDLIFNCGPEARQHLFYTEDRSVFAGLRSASQGRLSG